MPITQAPMPAWAGAPRKQLRGVDPGAQGHPSPFNDVPHCIGSFARGWVSASGHRSLGSVSPAGASAPAPPTPAPAPPELHPTSHVARRNLEKVAHFAITPRDATDRE